MSIWEYTRRLPSDALGIVAAVFVYLALSCLIRIKNKRWCKVLLFLSCWQASFMIIYIGDMVNLSFSMVIFLTALWIACEGTGSKKLTLGMMFASMIYAFNGFWDNGVGFFANHYGKDDFYGNMYLPGRVVFAVLLYLTIRSLNVEKDFELSRPLWRLMLLLTLSPLGIMISVILFSSPHVNLASIVLADSALFLVVMLSFVGLLRAPGGDTHPRQGRGLPVVGSPTPHPRTWVNVGWPGRTFGRSHGRSGYENERRNRDHRQLARKTGQSLSLVEREGGREAHGKQRVRLNYQ